MVHVNIKEAQNQLPALINAALRGEQVLIQTDEEHQILLVEVKRKKQKPQFGCAKGKIKIADDFDDPLVDFAPYM